MDCRMGRSVKKLPLTTYYCMVQMCDANANPNVKENKVHTSTQMQGKRDTQLQCQYFSKMAEDNTAFVREFAAITFSILVCI